MHAAPRIARYPDISSTRLKPNRHWTKSQQLRKRNSRCDFAIACTWARFFITQPRMLQRWPRNYYSAVNTSAASPTKSTWVHNVEIIWDMRVSATNGGFRACGLILLAAYRHLWPPRFTLFGNYTTKSAWENFGFDLLSSNLAFEWTTASSVHIIIWQRGYMLRA